MSPSAPIAAHKKQTILFLYGLILKLYLFQLLSHYTAELLGRSIFAFYIKIDYYMYRS